MVNILSTKDIEGSATLCQFDTTKSLSARGHKLGEPEKV
jgi:hypothetical protein